MNDQTLDGRKQTTCQTTRREPPTTLFTLFTGGTQKMPRFAAPRSGKKKAVQTPRLVEGTKVSDLFSDSRPTPTNKTLNLEDDDESGYTNTMESYAARQPSTRTVHFQREQHQYVPPTSSLTARKSESAVKQSYSNHNSGSNFGNTTRDTYGKSLLGRSDPKRSALASSLFAQDDGILQNQVSSPFEYRGTLKASAPHMSDFSHNNYASADPGLSPVPNAAASTFSSRSAKKAKKYHDSASYREGNIQMANLAAAKANAALISMSNHHDDISVEMKTQVAFGGDDIFGLEQANVQGHIVEPNPIPMKPRFPVHPNYKGFEPKKNVSATQAILNKVLNEIDINTSISPNMKPRLDPADYMSKSFGISFGINGKFVVPKKTFPNHLIAKSILLN